MPAVTVNQYGKGKAYYIAFRDTGEFTDSFYALLIEKLEAVRHIYEQTVLLNIYSLRTIIITR